jgi:uncharacterized SAM-binding protein YcdF (DUF218 family)
MLTIAKALGVLLMPLGVVVLLLVLGLLLRRRSLRFAIVLSWWGVAVLVVLSLPITGHFLCALLENSVPPLRLSDVHLRERVDAIVVLGAGRNTDAPEYGGETVSRTTLERLRYGARLHRATKLPLLVTGGSVFGESVSEAALMQRVLAEDFGVRAAWVETRSRNTYENALYSRPILQAAGVHRAILVTHALHMPRALWAFQHAGVDAIAAPMGYTNNDSGALLLDLLPSANGLELSSGTVHEWLGLIWYQLAYRNPPRTAS